MKASRIEDMADREEYLRSLIDPFELALLTAEPDDEPLTEHELVAIEEAERRRERGERPLSHEDVLRDLGLTESDLA